MAMSSHPGPPGELPERPEGGAAGRPADEHPAAGRRERPAPADGYESPEEERLPCGRTLGELWDDGRDDGRPGRGAAFDPHPADCPHCAAALDGLRILDDFARDAQAAELAAEAAAASSADGEMFTARVMDLVRQELRPGRSLPLGEPSEDHWIGESAAAKSLRAAAEALPGVRAGSCRISPAAGSPRGPVRVRLEVVAGLGLPVPELAAEVRLRVAEAARDLLGMEVAGIDIRVAGVHGERLPGAVGDSRSERGR